jgi:catechol 2,3-dioxygenase-like lactoylglutathione lyase family enzyme
MEQRISLVTLGVADLPRSKAFYEALDWQGQEIEETVFFQTGGLAIVLWARAKVAADGNVDDTDSSGFGGMTLAHNVRSRDAVDAVMAEAEAAGAIVTEEAEETFYGGYAGFFTDPDGHVWEIAHNPGFTLTDTGELVLPDFGVS